MPDGVVDLRARQWPWCLRLPDWESPAVCRPRRWRNGSRAQEEVTWRDRAVRLAPFAHHSTPSWQARQASGRRAKPAQPRPMMLEERAAQLTVRASAFLPLPPGAYRHAHPRNPPQPVVQGLPSAARANGVYITSGKRALACCGHRRLGPQAGFYQRGAAGQAGPCYEERSSPDAQPAFSTEIDR